MGRIVDPEILGGDADVLPRVADGSVEILDDDRERQRDRRSKDFPDGAAYSDTDVYWSETVTESQMITEPKYPTSTYNSGRLVASSYCLAERPCLIDTQSITQYWIVPHYLPPESAWVQRRNLSCTGISIGEIRSGYTCAVRPTQDTSEDSPTVSSGQDGHYRRNR